MSRTMLALAALSSIATLAACTSPTGSPVATVRSGSACAAEIAAFSDIVENDHTTGNLAQRVYAKMMPQIDRADAACGAGRSAEALKMLDAIKGRYGFR